MKIEDLRHSIQLCVVCLLCLFCASSCLDSDSTEIVYYDDTAITSFNVGTLNRYIHTKSSAGEDSVYKTTFDCSSYKFYIDQLKHEIYNADSLPLGVDVSKVLVSATSKNGGFIAVNIKTQDKTADSLKTVTSTDSLDFTNPLEFRVYNTMGTAYRSYMVRVNVHQEVADSFIWRKYVAEDNVVASMQGMRVLSAKGKLWLMGNDGTGSRVYMGSVDHGIIWKEVSTSPFAADAYKDFTLLHGVPSFLSDGILYQCQDDGQGCLPKSKVGIAHLYGSGYSDMYGLSDDGAMLRASTYDEWQGAAVDTDARLLPTQDARIIPIASKVNDNAQTLLLIGNRDASYQADTTAVVWGKVEEQDDKSQDQPWFYYTPSKENMSLLPRMDNLQVVEYDFGLLALGGKTFDGKQSAFAHFYRSEDMGVTWHVNATFNFPSDFSSSDTSFAMVTDDDGYLWVLCGGTGQVWRGRTNRLGWNQEQVGF